MRGLRSASGDATTTKRDHTARWDAFHRPSSQRVTASKQYQPKRSFNLATTALRTNGWYRLRGQVTKAPKPTAKAYLAALRKILPTLSDGHLAMLKAHYHAPNRVLTATQLAEAAGYSGYE